VYRTLGCLENNGAGMKKSTNNSKHATSIALTVLKGLWSAAKGLGLTFRHLQGARKTDRAVDIKQPAYFDQQEGLTTIQYPTQKIPIPEVGRYQLDVMMDDCIVCDLCAKACPVDCITIEPIRAVEPIGETSDGSVKRIHAAKFEIDMAKCMYCGLCTVVCPTECIIMTDQYDKTTPHLSELVYTFADMDPAEAAEKRQAFEQFQAEKAKSISKKS
jgi:NADH-quinone oxidoreductase subunit I